MIQTAALLAVLLLPQNDPSQGKLTVTDGRTGGVFYGMSMIADLWGNFRRQVWTLKADGTLLFGAPEGSLEDYLQRAPSATEKAELGTYSINGDKFQMTYRDGSKGDGTVEYHGDGTIKTILASGLRFYPVRSGLPQPLAGYWNNSVMVKNGALKMSTTVATSYSFMAGGIFVHESAACTIATAIQERTRETSGGIETIRQEVNKFYGGDTGSKMGKFEVKGSALLLTYDNGTKESKFIGRLGDIKKGESSLIFIGNALYDGTFGVFPKPAGAAPAAAAAAPATGLARCRGDHFELAVPAGWHARQEDLDGTKAFVLTPADDSEGRFSIILTGTALDNKKTKAADPEMVASLDALATAWVKGEKPAKEGDLEKFTMGGVEAVRLRYGLAKDGAAIKMEAACAVREGCAIVALTLASDASMKQYGAAAQELLSKTGFAEPVKVELKKVKGDGYDVQVPKTWNTKENEQNNVKTLVIVPPSGESEFVIQIIPSEAGEHKVATEPGAVQELRDLVMQIAPALKQMGAVETLQAGGQPASGVVFGGRNEKDEVILLKAYLTLKAKKALVILAVGKERRDKEYGALVRQAIESITWR